MKVHRVKQLEQVWSSAPSEYDYVTFELLFDRDPVVVINRENGLENLEVELFGPTPHGTMTYKLPLDQLIDALIDARDAMNKSDWRESPT